MRPGPTPRTAATGGFAAGRFDPRGGLGGLFEDARWPARPARRKAAPDRIAARTIAPTHRRAARDPCPNISFYANLKWHAAAWRMSDSSPLALPGAF